MTNGLIQILWRYLHFWELSKTLFTYWFTHLFSYVVILDHKYLLQIFIGQLLYARLWVQQWKNQTQSLLFGSENLVRKADSSQHWWDYKFYLFIRVTSTRWHFVIFYFLNMLKAGKLPFTNHFRIISFFFFQPQLPFSWVSGASEVCLCVEREELSNCDI